MTTSKNNENLSPNTKPSVNDIVETQYLCDIVAEPILRMQTGYPNFDRVFGPPNEPGLPTGKITTLAGDPGVGKSRLMIRIIANLVKQHKRCFYCLTEETKGAFRQWANNVIPKELIGLHLVRVTDSTNPNTFLHELDTFKPALAVVDSMKMLDNMNKEDSIKDFFIQLKKIIGRNGTHVVLICQMTKGKEMAGSNLIPHAGDVKAFLRHCQPESLKEYTDMVWEKKGYTAELNACEATRTNAQHRKLVADHRINQIARNYRDNYVPSFIGKFQLSIDKNRCGPAGGVALFEHTSDGNVAPILSEKDRASQTSQMSSLDSSFDGFLPQMESCEYSGPGLGPASDLDPESSALDKLANGG